MSIFFGLLVPALSQQSCFGSLSGIAAGYGWPFGGPLDGLNLSVHVLKGHGRMARRRLGSVPPFGFCRPRFTLRFKEGSL